MRYGPLVIYALTLSCAFTAGYFEIKTRQAMEDILDWGKLGPGSVEKMFRDVVRQYKLLEPNGELTKRYQLYAKLKICFAVAFIVEIIFFQHPAGAWLPSIIF